MGIESADVDDKVQYSQINLQVYDENLKSFVNNDDVNIYSDSNNNDQREKEEKKLYYVALGLIIFLLVVDVVERIVELFSGILTTIALIFGAYEICMYAFGIFGIFKRHRLSVMIYYVMKAIQVFLLLLGFILLSFFFLIYLIITIIGTVDLDSKLSQSLLWLLLIIFLIVIFLFGLYIYASIHSLVLCHKICKQIKQQNLTPAQKQMQQLEDQNEPLVFGTQPIADDISLDQQNQNINSHVLEDYYNQLQQPQEIFIPSSENNNNYLQDDVQDNININHDNNILYP
eukprot:TRINITY_DN2428_c0_g1_i1.p1 TRINITY_DN2428_c0_g1~~TRINITY_DN2428_c0_g1_i1.p1  ORF type:complete len:287 (+),score=80.75 TRINITY_DN2428_c0_g1_i1:114-974(+)